MVKDHPDAARGNIPVSVKQQFLNRRRAGLVRPDMEEETTLVGHMPTLLGRSSG
jgi:hypothetical protein